jgi:RsiW-degrading membrane proteinase PrsW (M82 family)
MPISMVCGCGTRLHVRDVLAGSQVPCPACGRVLEIPFAELDVEVDDSSETERPSAVKGPTLRFSKPAPPVLDTVRTKSEPLAEASPRDWPEQTVMDPFSETDSSIREHLYWLLVVALIPLAFSLLVPEPASIRDRLQKRLEREPRELAARFRQMEASHTLTREAMLSALPDHRLDNAAHLAMDSNTHWVYAMVAALVFLVLIRCCFSRESIPALQLLAVGLFTGTIGIVFLLAVQFLAGHSGGLRVRGRGVVILVILFAKFIAFSYQAALGDSGFLLSFLGFTCGVGLCEELCKALPLFAYFHRDSRMGLRGACLWGLASGAGFGISEGVMYAGDHYNGISGPGIYLVRFISCVALHAMWAGSVGITMYRHQDSLRAEQQWHEYAFTVLRILAVPMILHGLYDTLLKKEMNAPALAVAVISFAWLAWNVEFARRAESVPAFA